MVEREIIVGGFGNVCDGEETTRMVAVRKARMNSTRVTLPRKAVEVRSGSVDHKIYLAQEISLLSSIYW